MDGPQRGQPTPEFYRFIVSLLGLAGGSVPIPTEQINELFFTQSPPLSGAVDELTSDVAELRAAIAGIPAPRPDLSAAVSWLQARIAAIQRPPPDLTDAVGRLSVLIAMIPKAPVALNPSPIANAVTGSPVALNNIALFFDGPSVAQGKTGVWFVSGAVTVWDTAAAARINVQLWDGTTVIASGRAELTGANLAATVSLSGYLAAPAGNLRISAQDATNTTGQILNDIGSGNNASSISAFRIA